MRKIAVAVSLPQSSNWEEGAQRKWCKRKWRFVQRQQFQIRLLTLAACERTDEKRQKWITTSNGLLFSLLLRPNRSRINCTHVFFFILLICFLLFSSFTRGQSRREREQWSFPLLDRKIVSSGQLEMFAQSNLCHEFLSLILLLLYNT